MSSRTLAVTLPGSPIYVSGTVNEAAVIWTLEDGVWQATAKQSADDLYRVRLTAVDGAGNRVLYETVLRCGLLGLVTDRTRADVEKLKGLYARGWEQLTGEEKAWILDESQIKKGAYGPNDLNRVGEAVAYLADWFQRDGYAPAVEPKTDWVKEDIPRRGQVAWMLDDVKEIRNQLAGVTPLPASLEGLDWQGANRVEEALLEAQSGLMRLEQNYIYAGEGFSGEF